MFQEGIYTSEILKIDGNHCKVTIDTIAIEEPLEIIVAYKNSTSKVYKVISITMRTPGNDIELATGFLFNEGIIDHVEDILDIDFRMKCDDGEFQQQSIILELKPTLAPRINQIERHFYTNSSCGVCGRTSIELLASNTRYIPKKKNDVISSSTLFKLSDKLTKAQSLFSKTGAIHASGIFSMDGSLIHFTEDVGRHNAMDKMTGWCIQNKLLPLSDHILVFSGRTSFELVHKALCAGLPIVASVGAPSSLAVQTSEYFGLTLIGFLRENRLNIYSHPYRINQFVEK